MEAIAPQCSNTHFGEAEQKSLDLHKQIMALDAIGDKTVVTEEDMIKAVDALNESMDRWGGNEKYAVQQPNENWEDDARLRREKIMDQFMEPFTK